MAEIRLTKEEIEAAVQVLHSGALRQGKVCEYFENDFAHKTGAEYAVTCANGSAALHLAYMTFLEPNDEVLVPAFTFFATGSMVAMSQGKPVFCDIDSKTFLIDLEDAESKISSRTKAIAPVHLFGNSCDIESIKKFAEKHDLITVWDAAQAHGAEYKGHDVGSFGDFVCYSFYPSKNMFVGEGGMICTNNPEFKEKLRLLRSHGQSGKYLHTMLGLNYRMTDVEAAIGLKQLKRLDEMVTLRRRNAEMLNHGLFDTPGITPQQITSNTAHAWHQYCVVVDKEVYGCDRDALATRLNERGISTGVHYPRGLHHQPIFQELFGKVNLPKTERLAQTILALPIHHGLVLEDIKFIIAAIKALSG